MLKYRLGPKYHHPIELGDAQRAIRMVRARAEEFRVQPDRIGIMGFSAGGHLASSAGRIWRRSTPVAGDPIDKVSSRPDFLVLGYPVISFTTSYVHKGSMRNLLGDNPDPKLVELMSNELQVTPQTPPTFLFHTNGDTAVPAENSVLFYLALRKAGVPAEMHIYERGPHGVGLAQTDEALATWPGRLAAWLRVRGLLSGTRSRRSNEARLHRRRGLWNRNDRRPNPSVPRRAKGGRGDDYHGTKVADPYRWLEDTDSAETAKWVEAENAVTREYLAKIPRRASFKDRLLTLYNYERFNGVQRAGARYLITRNDGLQNQDVLYVADSLDATPRVLLDPNTLRADGTAALAGFLPES